METKIFKNQLLQRLEPEAIERLRLQHVELPVDREIEYPGNKIANLFFLEEGIASMTATFEDGFEVEIGLSGREHVLGTSSMFGTRRSLHRVYMQVGGHGYSSEMETAIREFKRGSPVSRPDLAVRSSSVYSVLADGWMQCTASDRAKAGAVAPLVFRPDRGPSAPVVAPISGGHAWGDTLECDGGCGAIAGERVDSVLTRQDQVA